MKRCRALAVLSMGLAVLWGTPRVGRADVAAPVFTTLGVSVNVVKDATTGEYTYTYQVINPSSNTLAFWAVSLDVSSNSGTVAIKGFAPDGWAELDAAGLGVPEVAAKQPLGERYAGWVPRSGLGEVQPGQTVSGLGLRCGFPPNIRALEIDPQTTNYIKAVVDDLATRGQGLTQEQEDAIVDKLTFRTKTLGPLSVPVGTFEHWDTYISDVAQAGQLGWIADPALLSGIQANLAAARQAALAQDGATTRARLQAVIDAIQSSTPAQRTSEGYALVLFNAQALQAAIPEPTEPKLTLTPPSATHPLGETATLTATLVNVATGRPMGGRVVVGVASGPNEGISASGYPDPDGHFVFSYPGRFLGDDQITARAIVEPQQQIASATVRWQGGADLAITLWSPPLLKTAPGNEFIVHEETSNIGDFPAPASVTLYFIWNSETGALIGQRDVPALAPGAASRVDDVRFTVPAELPPGLYTLAACADGEDTVAETNEANNCSDSNLLNQIAIIPAMPAENRPPDCTAAAASPSLLWPPNHKLVPITITGVTDPDNDQVTITITGITQDEPTNGLGDGDTAPDGFGVGTSHSQVRAERSGTGNGRVYVISFRAEDGKGGSCTGVVKVGVPHDKKDTPIDDGQKYDSTK